MLSNFVLSRIRNTLRHDLGLVVSGYEFICEHPKLCICCYDDGIYCYDESGEQVDYYCDVDEVYLDNNGNYDKEMIISFIKNTKQKMLKKEIQNDFN